PGDGRDQHERQAEQVEPFFLKKCFQSCSSSPVCRLVVTHSVAHGGGIYARRGGNCFAAPPCRVQGFGFGWSAACARGGFPIRPVRGGRERPPYGAGETRRPPGKMQFPRYTVGADSISARFTAAQGSAGGINPAPTGKFCVLGKPGGPRQGRP